ncbi:unnamed protein product [Phyllotreta striolata]|uniref:VPS9 domain-containing protein n=1 Tax=Phyllotreta striolata TaxID=444603 RepID=A0A9N9TM81_PHYSR|nr:unnamed protein product [Phyllotreta striolata]
MWSHQYDENLSANPFFKEINENHSDIIEESAIQNWVICVPRIGTVEPEEISSEVILDHILVCPKELGEYPFFTLTKKRICVENKQIITNSDNSKAITDILFEETFYYNKSSKFIVWCIDRPLFFKHKFCDSHSSKNLIILHDCIDFLWCESLSHNILDSIKNVVSTFKTNYQLEIENLQTQKEIIGCLFSQCLQICFKNDVLKEKCRLNEPFMENLKVAVETYMQYCLGKRLMFSINTISHHKDGHLNKIIRNSSHVQYKHLGIDSDFADVISSAKNELKQINTYWTILDKVECLKKTLKCILESGNVVKNCITSDNVLQILAFLILKLNVNNWYANLTYIKEFKLSTENSDRIEYCIASFEAAVEFVSSSEFWSIKTNTHEEVIDFLEKKIESGEAKTLSVEKQSLKNLCHPLCSCSNCRSISKCEIWSDCFGDLNECFLICAANAGKCDVVEYLLNRGVNVDYSDCSGKTALHYAASKGLQNVVLLLVNKNCNVNQLDNEKNTPLHLASLNGHENCIKALIYSSPEVDINATNSFGDSPLILATRWGYLDLVKILLENGASVSIKNKRNQTVFDVSPNFYITRTCEKYSARQLKKIDRTTESDSTYPTNAVAHLKDGCNSHGVRPKTTEEFKKIDLLLKSIENNDLPLTCFYLGYTNTATVERGKCHPLCLCDQCMIADRPDADRIANQSINVNMCDASGRTALHVAAEFGRTDILRLLLDNGALPNAKTFRTLRTPLHVACMEGRIRTVRELLKCGDCAVDEQDADGNTALSYACEKGDAKIAEVLLCNGADCNRKNLAGKSALSLSEESMQYGIYRLLKNNVQNMMERNVRVSSAEDDFF